MTSLKCMFSSCYLEIPDLHLNYLSHRSPGFWASENHSLHFAKVVLWQQYWKWFCSHMSPDMPLWCTSDLGVLNLQSKMAFSKDKLPRTQWFCTMPSCCNVMKDEMHISFQAKVTLTLGRTYRTAAWTLADMVAGKSPSVAMNYFIRLLLWPLFQWL